MRGSRVRPSFSGATMTAAACVCVSRSTNFLELRNAICPAPACSSEPTWRIRVCGSPATRPPRREAICPSVNGPGMRSFGGRLAFQRLDHLVGDVDARADVGRHLLEDDVEFLLLRDLPDYPVRLLDDLRELLVSALVQVLAELALLSLEVAVELAELALLGAALALGHGHGFLVQLRLHALQVGGDPGELAVALLELGLDLLLRPHRGGRVAQDALGMHEAELAARGRRSASRLRGRRCRQRRENRREDDVLH